DQHDNLVEALLRADRLRHDLAEAAQQHARTAERATHGVRSSGDSGNQRSASVIAACRPPARDDRVLPLIPAGPRAEGPLNVGRRTAGPGSPVELMVWLYRKGRAPRKPKPPDRAAVAPIGFRLLVEAVEGMQPSDGEFGGVGVDQQGKLDLRGGDRPDV